MAPLPNQASADIDVAKLRDYCLNATHPRGRHKARMFLSALGITSADAAWLRESLMRALPLHDAERQVIDQFGERWAADLALARQGRKAVIRTVWIIRTGEAAPRLVTCWVL